MIKVIQNKHGRFYPSKDGFRPSITTIQRIENKPGLNIWRGRVGNEEADRISKEATGLGDQTHLMIAHYLRTQKIPFSMNPVAVSLFFQAKAWIDKNVKKVLAVEESLICGRYGGTLDLRCILRDDAHAIIDWKTSKQCGDEMADQLSAQQALYEETYVPSRQVDKLLIIRLKKKEHELANPKIKVQEKSYDYDMTVFNACMEIYYKRYWKRDMKCLEK